jgi:hypothetical protein
MFWYPGTERTVERYNSKPFSYTPKMPAYCLIWPQPKGTIIDIRATRGHAGKLRQCINRVLGATVPDYVNATVVRLPHALTCAVKKKLHARTAQLRVNEADELDNNDKIHPAYAEYGSKNFDLLDGQAKLGVSGSATHEAQGLEFDAEVDGVKLRGKCRILIHHPTNTVSFTRATPLGVYDLVIRTIMEANNEQRT